MQKDLNNNILQKFDSIFKAILYTSINRRIISAACKGLKFNKKKLQCLW